MKPRIFDKLPKKKVRINVASVNQAEAIENTDVISLDVPLLIRVMEYAKEDAKDDQDLHFAAEKMIELSAKGTLTMDDYEAIFGTKEPKAPVKKESDTIDQAIDTLLEQGGSRYAWMIDKDVLFNPAHEDKSAVGVVGPRNASSDLIAKLNRGEGDKFEMRDDDGELYYKGRIVGNFEGFEPLDDYGTPNAGCTSIRYTSGPLKGKAL